MPTHQDAKGMAKSLQAALADRSVSLSHSECLEMVARQFGFANWNILSANLPADDDGRHAQSQVPERASPTTTPAPQACSFCGKSQQDVRSLIEGGCSRPRRTPESCVFICDECVAFCAQINADTGV
jgi:hypothetical protein